MPTYEYRCLNCDNRVEVVQSFRDDPLTACEVCGGLLRKVIHPVGIQFKGSGFYSTDRRASQPMSRGGNNKQDKEKSEKTSSESGGESKTDSGDKPAATSDPAPAKKAEKSA